MLHSRRQSFFKNKRNRARVMGLLLAGSLGGFLFLSGQNLGAQETTLPAPDQGRALPAPERDSSVLPESGGAGSRTPAPDQGTALSAPGGAESRIPAPAQDTSALPVPTGDSFRLPAVESGGGASPPGRAAAGPGGVRREQRSESSAGPGGEAEAATAAGSGAVRRAWAVPSRGLYLGVMAGLTIPSYNTDDTTWTRVYGNSAVKGNVGGILGLLLGMDFGLLIGEAEVLVSFDNAEIDASSFYGEAVFMKGVSLHIPLLVKMDFHLGPVVLQPLAGPYFNFALGKLTTSGGISGKESYKNPPLGLTFGALAGLNLGGGLLFIDGRFELDLGKTEVEKSIEIWRRSAFMLNLGYQIYLGRKK